MYSGLRAGLLLAKIGPAFFYLVSGFRFSRGYGGRAGLGKIMGGKALEVGKITGVPPAPQRRAILAVFRRYGGGGQNPILPP